jgi:hypothetical protein
MGIFKIVGGLFMAILVVLVLLANIVPLLKTFTGKDSVKELTWLKRWPRWVRFLLIGMVLFIAATVILVNYNPPKGELASNSDTITNTITYNIGNTTNVGPDNPVLPPVKTESFSKRDENALAVRNNNTSVNAGNHNEWQVIVKVGGEQDEYFSNLLSEYCQENSYKVVACAAMGANAAGRIAGELSMAPSNQEADRADKYVLYVVKLILITYPNGSSVPCNQQVYQKKLPFAPGDSKDKLIRQGFLDLLHQIKTSSQAPV